MTAVVCKPLRAITLQNRRMLYLLYRWKCYIHPDWCL